MFLAATAWPLQAKEPGDGSKLRPVLAGREVSELLVTAPIVVGGRLPPGLPTTRIYTLRPNRFFAVRENHHGFYFQADGTAFAEGSASVGGLFISKASLEEMYVYRGDGRYPKMYLSFVGRVQAADLSKVRIRFTSEQRRK